MLASVTKCECADKGCPVHRGHSDCIGFSSITLYRVDMYDESGTGFCAECADDAFESGLFYASEDES